MLNIFSINGSIDGKIIPHEDGSMCNFTFKCKHKKKI